ncbi:hypothetical protein ABID56_002397 [Alkalibacillus flavidus]|uniref:Uncharacterized protein n=1 Tax=Alkalibacillus flavidus TaxID=546021 RepID=A0ABV2KXG8_9BACI
MVYVLITLLTIGISLFIMSFFMTNRFRELEQELEQLSMTHIQEQYVMKNKIKVLEEELLTDTLDLNDVTYLSKQTTDSSQTQTKSKREPAIVSNVKQLYEQGYSYEEIEAKTGLAQDDIKIIIQQKANNQAFA